MKKSLIALAVAGAMTVPAIASADATLYGSMRMVLEKADNTSAELRNPSTGGSRIGIKGTVDLGLEDTKGIFLWETGINPNNSGTLSNRYAHIGATGSWGTAMAGRMDHPTELIVDAATDNARLGSNYANSVVTDYPDTLSNTLAYVSPNMSGFQVIAGAVFAGDALSPETETITIFADDADGNPADFEATSVVGNNRDKNIDGYNIGATYSFADLTLGAAYGAVKSGKDATGDYGLDLNKWGLSAQYQINAFSLAAKYAQIKDKADDEKIKEWGVAASYEVDGMGATLNYQTAKADNDDRLNATHFELFNKMGNGVVGVGYVDYNSASELNDKFYVGYRLNF